MYRGCNEMGGGIKRWGTGVSSVPGGGGEGGGNVPVSPTTGLTQPQMSLRDKV